MLTHLATTGVQLVTHFRNSLTIKLQFDHYSGSAGAHNDITGVPNDTTGVPNDTTGVFLPQEIAKPYYERDRAILNERMKEKGSIYMI